MKRTKRRPVKKRVIRSRERAQALFEGWRKKLTNLQIELKRPRVIDTVLVDFLRDEVPERQGQPTQKFSGRLIFFTKDDATIPTRIRTNETFAVRLSSVGVAKLGWA